MNVKTAENEYVCIIPQLTNLNVNEVGITRLIERKYESTGFQLSRN